MIAVERDGTVLTDIGPNLKLERDDALVIAGTDDAVNRFNELSK